MGSTVVSGDYQADGPVAQMDLRWYLPIGGMARLMGSDEAYFEKNAWVADGTRVPGDYTYLVGGSPVARGDMRE